MTARVLVVDDEKMVRWTLAQALGEAGYQVDEASDAAEALRIATGDLPDVVLLDYRLPDRTGVEVLRDLRKLAPRLPVVMLTAHASIDGAVAAMKEGAATIAAIVEVIYAAYPKSLYAAAGQSVCSHLLKLSLESLRQQPLG